MKNPYENVVWSSNHHVPSCSHLHTATNDSLNKAYARGLRHIPFSNYYPSKPKYPLSDYFSNIPTDVLSSPNAEHVRMTNAYCDALHISGLGSLWESGEPLVDGKYVGVENTWEYAFTNIINNLQYPSGGGVIINHPNFIKGATIPVGVMKEMLDYDPAVLGMEIYNSDIALGTGAENGWALDKWDEVLKTGRRAWGFCVQDWDINEIDRMGCNVLLVDEYTEKKCLEAYRNGSFYGRLQITSNLKFSNISYNDSTRVLQAKAENANWISVVYGINGKVYRERYNANEISYTVPSNATYIRVEAGKLGAAAHSTGETIFDDSSDVIFSNPIMLTDTIVEYEKKKRQNTLMWF